MYIPALAFQKKLATKPAPKKLASKEEAQESESHGEEKADWSSPQRESRAPTTPVIEVPKRTGSQKRQVSPPEQPARKKKLLGDTMFVQGETLDEEEKKRARPAIKDAEAEQKEDEKEPEADSEEDVTTPEEVEEAKGFACPIPNKS